MKKIFTSLIFLISLLPSIVLSCSNPIVYNEHGVPINIYGGTLIIDSINYPEDVDVIEYNLKVENTNDQGLNITFDPSPDLFGVVFGTDVELLAEEEKDAFINVNIGGTFNSGEMYVTGQCEDGMPMPEGVIHVYVYGKGGSVHKCKGTDDSCGIWPDCKDLYDETEFPSGCINGYNREWHCVGNEPTSLDTCTSYCCRKLYGTEGKCMSNVCTGPGPKPIDINLDLTDGVDPASAKITLYDPDTADLIDTKTITGSGTITSPKVIVDFGIEYNGTNLDILVQDLNVTELEDEDLLLVLDDVTPTVTDLIVHRAYKVELPTQFSFSKVGVKIKYSDLTVDEDKLSIYRCGDYDNETNRCNEAWSKITTTLSDDYAEAEVTTFSVYMLSESTQSSTTTTIPDDDDDSSSSSSSSSSRRTSSSGTSKTTTTPSCDCESWSNVGCGENPCESGEMKQERACDPSNCDTEIRCVSDSSCTAQETGNETSETTETEMEDSMPTGAFAAILSTITTNWYYFMVIPIAVVGGLAWKFYPREFKFPSSTKGQYVAIKLNESAEKTEKKLSPNPIKTEIPKISTDAIEKKKREKTKRIVTEEIRNKAMKMDKKFNKSR